MPSRSVLLCFFQSSHFQLFSLDSSTRRGESLRMLTLSRHCFHSFCRRRWLTIMSEMSPASGRMDDSAGSASRPVSSQVLPICGKHAGRHRSYTASRCSSSNDMRECRRSLRLSSGRQTICASKLRITRASRISRAPLSKAPRRS